jgi:8-hydroxy-5-deazaflavin:NADPH oxidoreductase
MRGVLEEVADLLPGKLVIDTSNPISIGADGKVSRTLPDGQAAGEVVAGWLPKGTNYAKAFGTLPAPLRASGARRTPRPAVLFYATDDAEAATEVERLIRIAGFGPVGVGGVAECLRIEVGGDLHAAGGLSGRLVDREEAESLVSKSKSPAERR